MQLLRWKDTSHSPPKPNLCFKSIRITIFLMSRRHNSSSNVICVQMSPRWGHCNFWLTIEGIWKLYLVSVTIRVTISNNAWGTDLSLVISSWIICTLTNKCDRNPIWQIINVFSLLPFSLTFTLSIHPSGASLGFPRNT